MPVRTASAPDEFTTMRSSRGFVPSAALIVTSAPVTLNQTPFEITTPLATAGVMSAPPVMPQPLTTQSVPARPAISTSRYS